MCPPGEFDATPPSAHDALARRHRRRLSGQRPAAKAGPGAAQTLTDSEAPLAGGTPGPGPGPGPSAPSPRGDDRRRSSALRSAEPQAATDAAAGDSGASRAALAAA
jgi:hypothetical protein